MSGYLLFVGLRCSFQVGDAQNEYCSKYKYVLSDVYISFGAKVISLETDLKKKRCENFQIWHAKQDYLYFQDSKQRSQEFNVLGNYPSMALTQADDTKPVAAMGFNKTDK